MGIIASRFMLTVLLGTAILTSPVFAETPAGAEEKTTDEALVKAAEDLIQQEEVTEASNSSETKAVEAKAETATSKEIKESEIPVVLENKKPEKSSSNFLWRLTASLALISVVGGALIYGTRRWTRLPNTGGQKARIEMLHQYQLGHRRSLALVRVAGEVALIGITDQNINMIKPVTLIDDEIEGLMGKDFNNFLEDEFSVEDVRSALSPRA